MPLTSKGAEILSAMQKQYGTKKGRSVFYASINAKKITGAEGRKPKPMMHSSSVKDRWNQ